DPRPRARPRVSREPRLATRAPSRAPGGACRAEWGASTPRRSRAPRMPRPPLRGRPPPPRRGRHPVPPAARPSSSCDRSWEPASRRAPRVPHPTRSCRFRAPRRVSRASAWRLRPRVLRRPRPPGGAGPRATRPCGHGTRRRRIHGAQKTPTGAGSSRWGWWVQAPPVHRINTPRRLLMPPPGNHPQGGLAPVEAPSQLSRIENKRETPRFISKCADKLATAQRRVPITTCGPTAHEIQPAPHTTEETPVTTQIVILAAGMGSRLGRSLPKPLTELSDGRTIMQQQFDNIHQAFGRDVKVTIVVGYKLE